MSALLLVRGVLIFKKDAILNNFRVSLKFGSFKPALIHIIKNQEDIE